METLHALWLDGQMHGAAGMCDRCGATRDVSFVQAMTEYVATEENPDPNHPIPYCPRCAGGYREHWTEMWDEYNAGRL